tara:strand:+ start:2301 stop:2630 length:330 start_codon:yes stop_codon:yes gene_type:complete
MNEDYNKNNNSKYFKTIKDISKIIEVQEHTIRFWISKFNSIYFKKIGSFQKRKHFSNEDIEIFKNIKYLLKEKKYTIDGAIKKLNSKNNNYILVSQLKTISKDLRNLLK